MVLLIIGILLSGVLIPLGMQQEIEDIKETEQDLSQIKEALIGYAIQHQRLPCPDTDGDGLENDTNCDTLGALPWVELGVDKNDIWRENFIYQVDKAFSRKPHITTLTTESNLELKYFDSNINIKNNIAFIVISKGKNRQADGDNNNSDTTYEIADKSNFDDQLIWLSTPLLVQQLVASEQWHKNLE